MERPPVERVTLGTHDLDPSTSFERVEVRRITMAADVHPGPHWHNGPVFGVVEAGSVHFQVDGSAERVLRAGDVFHEPGHRTIVRFDATGEGVTFLAWFPVPHDADPELVMGPAPG